MPHRDKTAQRGVLSTRTGKYVSVTLNGLFRRNPVLVRALALAPVLAVSVSVKNGLMLAAVTFVVLTVTAAAANLLAERLPAVVRAAVLTVFAAAVATPLCMFCYALAPNVASSVGVFLPLTAVNGIILSRAEQFQTNAGLPASLLDGAANGAGFGLAILLISAVREMLGSGMLYGRPLPGMSGATVSLLQTPAGGFFILAFLMAAVQYARLRRARRAGKK